MRRDARLSLPEIASRLGVSRSTCWYWIKDAPLEDVERQARRATSARVHHKKRKDRGPRSALAALAEGRTHSPQEAGAIAEAATVVRLAIHQWKVMTSVSDGEVIDLYVTRPGSNRHLKIRVRVARCIDHGLPTVSLRRMHNGHALRYVRGDFDILVGYWLYSDTAYVWTFGEIEGRRASVTIGPQASEAWGKVDAAFLALCGGEAAA